MASSILSIARSRRSAAQPAPVSLGLAVGMPSRIHFWRGASGQRHLHTVYSLIECPALPKVGYLLVRRESDGARNVVYIGCGDSDAPSLNLAKVRQTGAALGANEVHVNFLAADDESRRLNAYDLRAGQFGTLSSEPMSVGA